MTAMEGSIYMEEVKVFLSNQLGLAENKPNWEFLHSYGLLKSPKIPNPKINVLQLCM
jgi:hypothetical protein